MEHLKALNEDQKQAVLATKGPVLVLAGAGAGKTRTIAHRIVHLVKGGVPAGQILAITFTNKAAQEMRERVAQMLARYGERAASRQLTVATFHSLCVTLLREYAATVGVPRHFTIYDRTDSLRAIKKALRELGEDGGQLEPKGILATISRAKGDTITRGRYQDTVGNAYYPSLVSRVWDRYEHTLKKEGALDFDDLLLETWRLLSSHKEVHERITQRFSHVHIDEYQDTNKVQYELARLLLNKECNIFCVGDLDQNVYSWRGSTIENILEFEREFPDATVLKLEQNYRSTQTIVAVSNTIIQKNTRRKEKTLFTKNPEGEKVSIIVGYDEHDEADHIVTEVKQLLREGIHPEAAAVLYRANFQSRVLEEAFLTAGIPYHVLGTRFFDRKEVKDALCYLRAALNPDSESDIRRTINTPPRGIGKVTADKLFTKGHASLSGKPREKVDTYFMLLETVRSLTAKQKASEVLAQLLDLSGIAAALEHSGAEEQERLENIKELVSLAADRYDSLTPPTGVLRLLEDAALATDQDELERTAHNAKQGVTLMTIHASKGLEFSHVFITGLEDGLFPHERAEGTKSAPVDDEEERRLFYVALTRAQQKVYLSYAQTRTVFGQRNTTLPSEFLLDIDEMYLDTDVAMAEPGKVMYLD